MRSFIIASCILIFILTGIIFSSLYIVNKTDSMLSICERIENSSSAETVDELIAEWQSCRNIIALAVHRTELEHAEDAILSLKSYIDVPYEFNRQLIFLKSALEHISNNQKITLDSIL